ncbi:hypothetical protein HN699_04490, partial [Candidatus Uhrbacteria bacterium]|nr:hypothetical protein [Candidatus Uhrbacteria bacterium]
MKNMKTRSLALLICNASIIAMVLVPFTFMVNIPEARAATCNITGTETVNAAYVSTNSCTSIDLAGTFVVTWDGAIDLGGGTVTVSSGTVTFSGALDVGANDDVVIASGATITHAASNATGVDIDARNVTVTGDIDVDEKGCQGVAASDGYGPNASNVCVILTAGDSLGGAGDGHATIAGHQGAGYGGSGGLGQSTGIDTGGATYGSATAPTHLGSSGGGTWSGAGGHGGGSVRLNATGTFTHNGLISANGGDGVAWNGGSGGGSGGSVYITVAGALSGSTGTFSADGGDGGDDADDEGGGGGGGRVSLSYGSSTFDSGGDGLDSSNFTVIAGTATGSGVAGDLGTVYVKDTTTSDVTVYHGFEFDTDFSANSFTVGTATANLYCDGSTDTTPSLTTTTTIALQGTFDCTHASVTGFDTAAGTGVTLSNLAATLSATNIWTMDDAVSVTLASASINSNVQWTNMTTLSIDATSSISANSLGCQGVAAGDGFGPDVAGDGTCKQGVAYGGAGDGHAAIAGHQGAGYGGSGGLGQSTGLNAGGATYGSATAPTHLGSSGGGTWSGAGGHGGGLVRLSITGTFTHNGSISVDGGDGEVWNGGGGGGSGGSVYVTAGSVIEDGGATGAFSADGGDGGDDADDEGGGGGGGRIRIEYGADSDSLVGDLTAVAVAAGGAATGTAVAGSTGTLSTADIYGPSISTAVTDDDDGDGQIDRIVLAMTEDVESATVAGADFTLS